MPDLFPTSDIAAVPLATYVSWFLEKANPNHNLVQLPPIQRNAVWNVAQVERLWDSLLRGFPIGSILLALRPAQSTTRSLLNPQQTKSETDGYFLLDGQQRTRALLLGFQATDSSRLWIDVAPQLHFDSAEYSDRQFLLRLLTTHQPWGMRRQNPNDKLSEHEKFNARSRLPGSRRYDYLVSPVEEADSRSWPVDARLPVPFDALLKLCGGYQGPFTVPKWSAVLDLLPAHLRKDAPIEATPHFYHLVQALNQLLASTSSANRTRSVALLLHQPPLLEADIPPNAPDDIEILFGRINAGGTRLDGEEMAYSLLKSSWDAAYELVTQIVLDKQVGYLMPPTGIVMAATRLARRAQGRLTDLNPSVPQFRRWLGEADTPFLAAMQRQLSTENSALFHQTLHAFCSLVLYREDTDPGLPKKLLLAIPSVLYHPVLAWIQDNLDDEYRLRQNRLGVLRYLFFVLITKPNSVQTAARASEVVGADSRGLDFPDLAIYESLVAKGQASPLPPADAILLPGSADGRWRTPDERLGSWGNEEQPADPYRPFREKFWRKKTLLLWFQRAHLGRWFQGYNPLSQDAADTPFDYDHLVPYSHLIVSGGKFDTGLSGNEAERIRWLRYEYVNSLGNYRAWPQWANRGDGNRCHTQKLQLRVKDTTSAVGQELDLATGADFLHASAIPLSAHAQWLAAGGSPLQWPQPRRQAWQQAVEERVSYFYNTLFITLHYGHWIAATLTSSIL